MSAHVVTSGVRQIIKVQKKHGGQINQHRVDTSPRVQSGLNIVPQQEKTSGMRSAALLGHSQFESTNDCVPRKSAEPKHPE